tara:strand:+ start:133956 stop:136940 length:2985 start_codon:yes stop_codon:yes gene_type:complete
MTPPGGTGIPKVFTIHPGRPFVDVLAESLLAETGGDPERLADYQVLLPTRRAIRALTEAFLRAAGGRTVLLPKLTPLGDVEIDELDGGESAESGDLDLAPTLPGMRRQALLASLIRAVPGRAETPDQALRLAQELARLMDQVATERLDFREIKNLIPPDHELAEHWQKTVSFLDIVAEAWPAYLDEAGCLDGAERRNRVLQHRAEAWRRQPPATPVIAAGSTGSIPATADLLAVIAGLPKGAVILPGLDRDMADDAWAALEPHHPQYGLKHLLARFGCDRAAVADWAPEIGGTAPGHKARSDLFSRALRPAAVTGAAGAPGAVADAAAVVAGLARIDCATLAEEASVIALALREALQTPGKTAALVTPDRALARRVKAELARWGVALDDSAGTPLAETAAGAFLRLTAALAAEDFAPVPLLAALKHPKAALAGDPAHLRALARRLETAKIVRGIRPAPGIAGLRAAVRLLKEPGPLPGLIDRLERAAAPFADLIKNREVAPQDLASAHLAFAEALAASGEETGAERLWAGEDGEAAARFMNEVLDALPGLGPVRGRDYPALLDSLMAGHAVRPAWGAHPRLNIWGLLEARLQQADLMILGGLNEGSWPPEAKPSPWMSRPMLADFGLPLPERRIGQTAHDFVQAAMAPEVLLTRAERVEGAPSVPARWLLRLGNLVAGTTMADALKARDHLKSWAAALDDPGGTVIPARPLPRPPVAMRPKGLSVTQVEKWVRDPYAVYARNILRLRPLDPIDADPGAGDRGEIIHRALELFIAAHPRDLPADAETRLRAFGEEVFAQHADRPAVRAFWWPRFLRVARWFIEVERDRRTRGCRPLAWEAEGALTLETGAGPFTLTCIADRIDRDPAEGFEIIDYKTGRTPTEKMVKTGFSPQLPLEAAVLRAGGFDKLATGEVAALAYWKMSGGREAGKITSLDGVGQLTEDAAQGLARRVVFFSDPATPYAPRVKPMFESDSGDYDHLARVRAWSAAGGEDGE